MAEHSSALGSLTWRLDDGKSLEIFTAQQAMMEGSGSFWGVCSLIHRYCTGGMKGRDGGQAIEREAGSGRWKMGGRQQEEVGMGTRKQAGMESGMPFPIPHCPTPVPASAAGSASCSSSADTAARIAPLPKMTGRLNPPPPKTEPADPLGTIQCAGEEAPQSRSPGHSPTAARPGP